MDHNERLEAALRRRDDLAAKKQRIQGRHEAAETKLSEVVAEITKKKLKPEDLPATIEKLEGKYEDLVSQIETEVASAEEAIAPFLEEN